MKKIQCLIVDDEPLARKGLENYCKEISFLEVIATCKNTLQINEYLQTHPIDLIFLDINMPLQNGLDWLKGLEKSPYIVMTTAYAEHALESFAYNVLDYLVKPISFERFLQASNKVHNIMDVSESEKVLFVKTNGTLVKVNLNAILFVESMQNYVKIVTDTEKIITHSTLKQLKELLPNTSFIQTHKSYIVSKNKISKVEGNILFIGEIEIPISVRLKKEVLRELL